MKAPIRLSGRGRSCLAEMLNLEYLDYAWCRGRKNFSLIQPVFVFDNKTCTWKPGNGRHWGRSQGEVDIRNYVKTCVF